MSWWGFKVWSLIQILGEGDVCDLVNWVWDLEVWFVLATERKYIGLKMFGWVLNLMIWCISCIWHGGFDTWFEFLLMSFVVFWLYFVSRVSIFIVIGFGWELNCSIVNSFSFVFCNILIKFWLTKFWIHWFEILFI